MIYVVCGMKRSGSTLIFQITHQLLSTLNNELIFKKDIDYNNIDYNKNYLIKTHYNNNLKIPEDAIYLYSYRDLRDVVASIFKKSHKERISRNIKNIVRTQLIGDEFFRNKKNIWIGKYEEFYLDIKLLIKKIADFLKIQVSREKVLEIEQYVSIENQIKREKEMRLNGIDDRYRITWNHITDGSVGYWKNYLNKCDVDSINGISKNWLHKYGYD